MSWREMQILSYQGRFCIDWYMFSAPKDNLFSLSLISNINGIWKKISRNSPIHQKLQKSGNESTRLYSEPISHRANNNFKTNFLDNYVIVQPNQYHLRLRILLDTLSLIHSFIHSLLSLPTENRLSNRNKSPRLQIHVRLLPFGGLLRTLLAGDHRLFSLYRLGSFEASSLHTWRVQCR